MQSVGLTSTEKTLCTFCGRPATFLSPIGALCTTDALIGAAFSDWIPTHLRQEADEGTSGKQPDQ